MSYSSRQVNFLPQSLGDISVTGLDAHDLSRSLAYWGGLEAHAIVFSILPCLGGSLPSPHTSEGIPFPTKISPSSNSSLQLYNNPITGWIFIPGSPTNLNFSRERA